MVQAIPIWVFIYLFECFSINNESQKFNFFLWNSRLFDLKNNAACDKLIFFFTYIDHSVFVYQNKSKYRQNKPPMSYPNIIKHY